MTKAVFYIVLLFALFSCHTRRGLMRNYVGGTDFWQYNLILKRDSSFCMSFKGHLAVDSAFGSFSMKQDSVFFFYQYSKNDSLSAMVLVNQFNRPMDSALLFDKSGIRALSAGVIKNGLLYHGVKLKRKDR